MSEAPFVSEPMAVEEQWLDFNGHLNMAFYNVLFDRGVDQIFETLGFGPEYRKRTGNTTFSAEFHLCYLRELHLGDEVTATFQLLDHDAKSFHFYQELVHKDGWISATGEGVGLHIDQSGPKVAPMPEDILARFEKLAKEHSTCPVLSVWGVSWASGANDSMQGCHDPARRNMPARKMLDLLPAS